MGYRGTAKQLMNPKTNIKFAAKYLRYQMNRYQDVKRAVVAYNIGNARGLTGSHYQRKVFLVWHNNYPEMKFCSLSQPFLR
jgi:soluble lytic murein transglycosylase-like protein